MKPFALVVAFIVGLIVGAAATLAVVTTGDPMPVAIEFSKE